MENNSVLIFDEVTRTGIIFDPSFEPEKLLSFIEKESIQVKYIFFTHGHFDHFAGLQFLLSRLDPKPVVGLHQGDLALWKDGGGAKHFRIPVNIPEDPDIFLEHGQILQLDSHTIEVRHTPGHSPGSVIFFIQNISSAIVGDLIFKQGVGRTDLDGGDAAALVVSIRSQIYTLPPETILIPGHGPNTTVKDEMENNPYIQP
jgi:glyoxylase-like metal-dependent hydrolase (beta-lactamase superfamily II)